MLYQSCEFFFLFMYNSLHIHCYEHIVGMRMDSPLSSPIANGVLWKTGSKKYPSSTDAFLLLCRQHLCGMSLWIGNYTAKILYHCNSIHPRIQFMMKVEKHCALLFLDLLVLKKLDDSLAHSLYRKPTHVNQCLHATNFRHNY